MAGRTRTMLILTAAATLVALAVGGFFLWPRKDPSCLQMTAHLAEKRNAEAQCNPGRA